MESNISTSKLCMPKPESSVMIQGTRSQAAANLLLETQPKMVNFTIEATQSRTWSKRAPSPRSASFFFTDASQFRTSWLNLKTESRTKCLSIKKFLIFTGDSDSTPTP